jgi:serine/threonine-protein kinase PknG
MSGPICDEPGCGGAVVDGYCDICGAAPEADGRADPTATAPAPPPTKSTAGVPSRRIARTGSSRSTSARGRLGAGVVSIPRVPKSDPAAAILVDPQVPERNRFCGNLNCRKPVGRTVDGEPGRAEGFCTQCGSRYSFVPKLSRGDLVGGQYEVQGCIAHGGLGWVYLAVDRNLKDRWVVLKGLINSGDTDAMAAAAAEVFSLVAVEHPNIVKIYNFVEHLDVGAGVPVGYIVMEYIGGTTLKQIRTAGNAPLPPAHAVAYVVEIASALEYLHGLGFAYCDFKPDNVMQSDEQVKLIDLGAVIAMDDHRSAIYGTVGYQAPEIGTTGPTVASDVYTVGRTLAALVMDVPHENGRLVEQLPGSESVPLFAQYESLYRAILRATDPDPKLRFSSMAELADQLTGVLHEIAAAGDDIARPRTSSFFSPQRAIYGVGGQASVTPANIIAALPVPMVDPNDSGAAVLATTSGTPADQLENALTLAGGTDFDDDPSVEVRLRLVRASLELGAAPDARKRITELEAELPGDWRLAWYSGQCALLDREFDKAAADFDRVLKILPGELGPKLAIAATAELREAHGEATRYYETIWRTEHSYYSAAFGLARERARISDRDHAIAALDQIPVSSAHFTSAGATSIEILLDGRTAENLDEETLLDAGKRAAGLALESATKRAAVRLRIFGAALDWLRAGNEAEAAQLLGVAFVEPGIRTGMERCYRELARATTDTWERISYVESANSIRPRTRL